MNPCQFSTSANKQEKKKKLKRNPRREESGYVCLLGSVKLDCPGVFLPSVTSGASEFLCSHKMLLVTRYSPLHC